MIYELETIKSSIHQIIKHVINTKTTENRRV
jgi:hypothetical protein